MKHDPRTFGRARPRHDNDGAGWQLRAKLERRRQARHAAICAGGLAVFFAIGTAAAMSAGSEGGAVLMSVATALCLLLGVTAAGEA